MTTLLIPSAGYSKRYPGVRPKWLLTAPDGLLAVQKAARSVPDEMVKRKVIAIRRDHEERFGASAAMRRAFGDELEILILDQDTNGPADTVSLMIERAEVDGRIFIKDVDSFFAPSTTMPDGSFVSVADLRKWPNMTRVGAKSFVIINEQGIISNIIEKSVISNYVSCGLYAFADSAQYQKRYRTLQRDHQLGEVFVSHVISNSISQGDIFTFHEEEQIVDVGTLTDWKEYTAKKMLFVIDIDGVVFKNQSEYFPPYWGDAVEPIAENVARLRELQEGGAQLVFLTSRPEKYRGATEAALKQNGLSPHALVMGAAHAARVLINDFAASNPYPSARAVNIVRNSPDLPLYLQD